MQIQKCTSTKKYKQIQISTSPKKANFQNKKSNFVVIGVHASKWLLFPIFLSRFQTCWTNGYHDIQVNHKFR